MGGGGGGGGGGGRKEEGEEEGEYEDRLLADTNDDAKHSVF